MPNPNAIIGRVVRLDPVLDLKSRGERVVILYDNQQVRLDPNDAKSEGLARILDGVGKLGRPVYFETDSGTGFVKRVLLPHVGRVMRIEPGDDGSLDVALERSHAIHKLKRESSDFTAVSERLEGAARDRTTVLIVTFEDDGTIIDVRGFRPGPDGILPPVPKYRVSLLSWFVDWLRWNSPFGISVGLSWDSWFGCVSEAKAQQVFDSMAAATCPPIPNLDDTSCIPFRYPDNGCWVRAHEMARLMRDMGLKARKVWIEGWPLKPYTKNSPYCLVVWHRHVAPTLCVQSKKWFWLGKPMVIDPSLFSTPVSVEVWKEIQRNSNARLTYTDWKLYLPPPYLPRYDPEFERTYYDLIDWRTYLRTRSQEIGPPPYPCGGLNVEGSSAVTTTNTMHP